MSGTFLTVPQEPEARRLQPNEIRGRIMKLASDIKETKATKEVVAKLFPPSGTKQWMISALDNRVVGLTEEVTFYAKALAGIQEVSLG